MPLPREKCPACERSVPVRRSGAFREHNRRPESVFRGKCPASGKTLEGAREIARAEVAKEHGEEIVAEAEAVLEGKARG